MDLEFPVNPAVLAIFCSFAKARKITLLNIGFRTLLFGFPNNPILFSWTSEGALGLGFTKSIGLPPEWKICTKKLIPISFPSGCPFLIFGAWPHLRKYTFTGRFHVLLINHLHFPVINNPAPVFSPRRLQNARWAMVGHMLNYSSAPRQWQLWQGDWGGLLRRGSVKGGTWLGSSILLLATKVK